MTTKAIARSSLSLDLLATPKPPTIATPNNSGTRHENVAPDIQPTEPNPTATIAPTQSSSRHGLRASYPPNGPHRWFSVLSGCWTEFRFGLPPSFGPRNALVSHQLSSPVAVRVLIGLLAGFTAGGLRWWAVGIVAVAWPVLLIVTDVDSGLAFFVVSAAVAALNTIVGLAAGINGRWLITSIVGQVRSHA